MGDLEKDIPLPVRLELAHAAAQRVASGVGVDLLHIKGVAVADELRPFGRRGSDVDVLVRPSQVERLDLAMRASGWTLYSTFVSGSPFGHAQTYLHDTWGYIDVHRFFPGIGAEPERAFEALWRGRDERALAGARCAVPSVPAQALILVLNDARSRADARRDLAAAWTDAPEERRAQVASLVDDLDAHVGFAAATGGLDRYRDSREYRMWKVASEGGTRSQEWAARVRSAPTVGGAARVLVRAPLVNVDRLTHRLGRQPSRREVAAEFADRVRRAVREALSGGRRGGAT
ncbi:hypothetical protein ARHIZOSPH14_15940 [Agromyces rhizosphaerae]|uniref:2-nitropropane dioxygenase n=1 Tax=Agromyces rhizosphaerae TaxID=88374 RepID=A0A9W6CY36_9MICO|nr:nucleotidyltransferase family protein [Agromyces rhizosphaerae]GLI27352.1 hypothetical protein ARHIZOSPH14_15940 [Agromyces rhizosphaerae]